VWPESFLGGKVTKLSQSRAREGLVPRLRPSKALVMSALAMEDTVLIVEDESDVVDLLRYNLTKAGFAVLIAPDGLSGLEMARKNRPDVVILDLMLPGMDGHSICKALKHDPHTEGIPILMLTAKSQPDERVKGLEIGADDYVTKPFSPRELVLRVACCAASAPARAATCSNWMNFSSIRTPSRCGWKASGSNSPPPSSSFSPS